MVASAPESSVGVLSHDGPRPAFVRPNNSVFTLGRRPALDGLRGVAILFVLGNHLQYLWPTTTLFQGGFFGVDIFFVLSGFLITSLLIEEQRQSLRISLRSFYRRRAYRLFPALWVLLGVTFVYSRLNPTIALQNPLTSELRAVGAVVVYQANWLDAFMPGAQGFGLPHLWSLGIEEQFYLVWPLVFIGLVRTGRRNLLGWFIGVSIVVSMAACAVEFHGNPSYLVAYQLTQDRVGSLMIGCGASVLVYGGWRPSPRPSRRPPALAVAASAIIIALLFVATLVGSSGRYVYYGGFTVFALLVSIVLLNVLEPGTLLYRLLTARWLCFTGLISYSLYLWHIPVFEAVAELMPGSGATFERVLIAYPIAICFALMSYYLVERPCVARAHRLRPSRRVSLELGPEASPPS